MRQELESMVHQIEAETADNGENGGAGRVPAGFCTLTCPVYKWHQLHETILKSYPSGAAEDPNARQYYEQWKLEAPGVARDAAMKKAFYELAVINPGAVSWYCSLKLEIAVHLTKVLLTQQMQSPIVPGLDAVKARIESDLRAKLAVDVRFENIPDLAHLGFVDAFYASFEWSSGGMLHAHMAFWIVGSPRIDKVIVPKEQDDNVVEITAACDKDIVCPQTEAATRMASFWDRAYTEFNVGKALAAPTVTSPSGSTKANPELECETGPRQKLGKKREKEHASPECISYKTLAHCVLGIVEVSDLEEKQCWEEFERILQDCSRATHSWNARPSLASQTKEQKQETHALARKVFVSALAEWVNMHDLHKPHAMGPPSKDQACAAVDSEHTSKESISCNKLFPRKCIEPGSEEIAEDPRRRELYRLWMARNCHFINNYVPLVLLAMLSNMDFQATLTKDAVIEYMTKSESAVGLPE